MARCSVFPSQVFWVYRQVADTGDVVIRKRRSAIVDTRAPVMPTPMYLFPCVDLHFHPYKIEIFLIKHRQGVRR